MAYRLPPFSALRAFEAAARALSFKTAADELHVTPAAISQQIKALEDYLDLRLFRRLPRRLELTAEAEAMLPKLREGFECLAAAVASTRRPGGALTISAPPNFAARFLLPRLPRFSDAHPEIKVRLSSSRDAIDQKSTATGSAATSLDPRDEDSAVYIRFGNGLTPGHRNELLLAPDYTPVCSPQLQTGARPLRTPADLRWHALIHDESIPEEALGLGWETWLRIAGAPEVDASRGLRFGSATLAIEAALEHQGVVLAPRQLVAAEVAAGRLATPFDVTMASRYFYYLATPEAVADRPTVRAFRDWILKEIASPL